MTARKVYLVTGVGAAQVGTLPASSGRVWLQALAQNAERGKVEGAEGEVSKLTPHLQPRRSVRMEPKLGK